MSVSLDGWLQDCARYCARDFDAGRGFALFVRLADYFGRLDREQAAYLLGVGGWSRVRDAMEQGG